MTLNIAQDHTALKQRSQNLNPGCLAPDSAPLIPASNNGTLEIKKKTVIKIKTQSLSRRLDLVKENRKELENTFAEFIQTTSRSDEDRKQRVVDVKGIKNKMKISNILLIVISEVRHKTLNSQRILNPNRRKI